MIKMSRRKPRMSSSDEEEESRSKRRRVNSEANNIEERLESLITRVGEKSTSSLESNLEGLASVLEADLSNYKTKILRILCDCVVKLPERLTVYTTLIGLLNARNYNAGGEYVESLVRCLKENLKAGEYENARIVVRFLADLVNCKVIVASSLLDLFEKFVEISYEEGCPQVRSDWYVHAILSALPWIGRELFEKKESELKKLLNNVDNYLRKRQKVHVACLRVWSSDEPHPQEEYLDLLWAQIQNLKSNQWVEKQILRPYLAFDGVLSGALQHQLPKIILPSHHPSAIYPLPTVTFRMFDYTDVPEGPVLSGSQTIDRYLIEEELHRMINVSVSERKSCAAELLAIPLKSKIPLNYMIVEVVFAQLFQLPRPPHLELFYGSLLIELCKLQPQSMPQVLAQATEMLYERLDTMNAACIERFVLWFAYHLSNFQFRWSWDDWADCLTLDPEMPKPKFVREVLLRCMRLSYHQRVVEIVPASFAPLLPKDPQKMTFKYEGEGAGSYPGTVVAHKLIQAFKTKCTPEEALILMRDLANPLREDDSNARYNPLKIEVFVQTLLYLGSKSFSHSFAAIAKFHDCLRALCETQEAQVCLLKSVFELHQARQQMLVVLVDKFLKTQVVDCAAVANWLFSPQMASQFTDFFMWEIMHSTIRKMNKQVQKLQKDLEDAREARERVSEAKRKVKDDDENDVNMEVPTPEEMERMEEKLEEVQGEQKSLFLIIFQRFVTTLNEHLSRCESEGRNYRTPWYKWVVERLQQVFLQHHEQVFQYVNPLERLMFTSDVDTRILEVFQQFCALRS